MYANDVWYNFHRADLMESDEVIKCLCHFQPVWAHQLMSWKAKPLKEPDSDISEKYLYDLVQ